MTEQFSTSPTNHITAIARDAEVAMQARRAIDAAAMSGVTVEVVDPDGVDDATHEDVKQRTATILLEAGATAVTYHGPWGIENLATPT